MQLLLEGIQIIVGNYGSGKTEIAVNLAAHQKRRGIDVALADLDLVNPYFRTREAREPLARMGIDVILPPARYMQADLPILDPAVAGMLRNPHRLTLLDAGGDDVGATVLAALADALKGTKVSMLQVVNPFRPYTDTVAGCLAIRHQIEAAAKLTTTGIIGNANLIDETTTDHIYEGYQFVHELSRESNLPLVFITAMDNLIGSLDHQRFACPVLELRRQMVPPWKRTAGLSP